MEERLYEFVFAVSKKKKQDFEKQLSEFCRQNQLEFHLLGFTEKKTQYSMDLNQMGRVV